MPTKREKSDYAREWYRNNKGRKDYEIRYYQEHKDEKRLKYEERHKKDLELSKKLGAKVNYAKKQNSKKERKLQEKITEIWRLTGEFIIPDEKMIKQVEKEILKEELLYEDTIDEVELIELEKNEDDDDTETD